MADTQHIEVIDHLDQLLVITYRSGISIIALGLLLPFISIFSDQTSVLFLPALAIGCGLIASSVHIYDKNIRWIIAFSTQFALLLYPLFILLDNLTLLFLVNGLLFVTLSGVALKESFCFQIYGLKLIPSLLIIALISNFAGLTWVSIISHGISAFIFFILSIKKWRMPLHFDIGNKSKYQI